MMRRLGRSLGWIVLAAVLLQVYFLARIALMRVVDPESTALQRSEVLRVIGDGKWSWAQQWVPYEQLSDNLKRAVVASEDSDFVNHDGIEWDAIREARARNAEAEARNEAQRQRAEARLRQIQERAQKKIERLEKHGRPVSERLRATASGSGASAPAVPAPKIAGGSTISQQLAKNLLLSTERNLFRKGQELVLTKYLEIVLGKRRILEIYLNNVEWGEGVFGAEAAARYYFHKPASALTAREAARLAVMLPRPRYFEQNLDSGYLASRSGVIAAREGDVEIPR
jgi:monofunctional biosynthetic peptidoglycan transglycosylase